MNTIVPVPRIAGRRPTGSRPLPDPPGPRGHFVLGNAPALWRDPTRTFLDGARRYGDVVHFSLGGPFHSYLLAHPDHVKHVLQEQHQRYAKPPYQNLKLKNLVGESVLTSEGDSWLRRRRLAQPAFHRQRVAAFGSAMTDACLAQLRTWEGAAQQSAPLDVAQEMSRLTLTIVARTLLGADVTHDADLIGKAVTTALEHLNRRMQSYLDLDALPLPSSKRFRRAVAQLDGIVYRIIAEHRRASADSGHNKQANAGDFLGLLLEARDADTGEGMSDRQLRDEVMTVFLAGHETTAILLTWTLYLLSRHPEVARRLRQEIATVLAGRVPTVLDLPNLRYTTMILEETLRLYPPAWALSRMAIDDDEVGGYRIRAGSLVFLSPYVTHRHPAFWENPEGFDPQRFAEPPASEPPASEPATGEPTEARRPRFAYFPFGGGPRQCIGNTFAMMEAQLLLPTILQRFQLDLVPGHRVALQPMITLRPRYGMLMRVRPASER
ncbi:MAG: cytochrome P450 [Chloroflexota bacterium]|nr:cytochrome P450 [Chloroflexota bacterium]